VHDVLDGEPLSEEGRGAAVRPDNCDVHHRYLSRLEYEAGGCFWCEPYLDRRPRKQTKAQAASESSRFDARSAQEALI
jgi:hypothetical protein